MGTNRFLVLLVVLLATTLMLGMVAAVEPFGATVTELNSDRAPNDSADNTPAYAGNISEIALEAFTITQSWAGYFGNVSGTIMLADAGDNVMYNWSLASPEGEVYAANQTVNWINVQCFNFTATGAGGTEDGTRGQTSQTGVNSSQIENWTNMAVDDVDGIDETFALLGAGTHDSFYTNNLQFDIGECQNVRLFDSSAGPVSNNFEEVLLYDPDNEMIVFTSILEETATNGFDSGDHDFEMIVLEDGHGTDVAVTQYYFYVEIE